MDAPNRSARIMILSRLILRLSLNSLRGLGMNPKHTLRHVSIALMLLVSFLIQGTWALAGTTGGLSGYLTDEAGSPVANAIVSVSSASTSASTKTDAGGHYVFLSLNPETYTVSISKSGYEPVAQAGVTVLADQTQSVNLKTRRALREIGRVTSRSATDVVRPGLTTDIYAVNPQQAEKAAALGGGGSFNSEYSAIASIPGVVVPQGQAGWNQSAYIRGANSITTGYEYDGVPVNRSFDNYAAHTGSNLGQQQLQVYTGGGPASSSAAGISGFVNQVIRTGTYPGFGTIDLGFGGPQYYHNVRAEVGGATPSRNFSYYAAVGGYNQDFRFGDQSNFGGPANANGNFAAFSPLTNTTFTGQGVNSICDANGAPPAAVQALPSNPGCLVPYNGFLANTQSTVTDRETVLNFHFLIPRKEGNKDDIQLLWSTSALRSVFYSSPNDLGPGASQNYLAVNGAPSGTVNTAGPPCTNYNAAPCNNVQYYADVPATYNLPFGAPIAGQATTPYLQPASPRNRTPNSSLPLDNRDLYNNDTGIVKAQYTHQMGSHAYARLFAYTFFSDWTQSGATNGYNSVTPSGGGIGTGVVAPGYDLITHTAGAELQLADQVSDKHLLQFTGNFTRANTNRFNNTGFLGLVATGRGTPTGLISRDASGLFHCYATDGSGTEVPCSTRTRAYRGGDAFNGCDAAFGTGNDNPTCAVTGDAAAAGAKFVSLWDGNADGTFNAVGPRFTSLSFTDLFKPTSNLTLNLGLRYDDFNYKLPSTVRPANDFYTQIVQNNACYDPLTSQPYVQPLGPTTPPPPGLRYVPGLPGNPNPCPAVLVGGTMHQYVHPNGTTQFGIASKLFTDVSPSSYTLNYFSPRVSIAYTASPDTVYRASGGRYMQPPLTAAVLYDRRAGTAATSLLFNSFAGLGFFSPFHAVQSQSAGQYDVSLERHIRNTDVSFKLTPYYRYTHNINQQVLIGQNFVTDIPVGNQRDMGVEFSLTKGDFNKNGFSGLLSYTYTNSKVQFKRLYGPANTQIDNINQAISDYNALTTSSRCYTAATYKPKFVPGAPDPSCANPTDILNPYFGKAQQGLLDPNGSYVPYATSLATTGLSDIGNFTYPHAIIAIVNYRKDRLAITPSVQFNTGTFYGAPSNVIGLDPRTCAKNSAGRYATAPSPLQPDYTTCNSAALTTSGYLFIPNPETGSFDSIGKYQQPSVLSMNAAITYELSQRVRANLTLTNLFHSCFGGSSTGWSKQFAPGRQTCGYAANGLYPANFYNGTGPNDVAANGVTPIPALSHPYSPALGVQPFPFNAYLSFTFKI